MIFFQFDFVWQSLRVAWWRRPPLKIAKIAIPQGGCLGPDLDGGGGRAPITPKAATPKAATPLFRRRRRWRWWSRMPQLQIGGKRGGFNGKAAAKAAALTTPKA
jgi:hypothetical protein